MSKLARLFTLGAAVIVLVVALAACGSSTSSTDSTQTDTGTKVEKLTLVAPPGPMAIPMAYIAANDRLADVAEQTEVVIWENADQLKAMLAGGQGDFVTVPSNNAATFYNKGVELRLLDISVWNITYLISSDPDAVGFSDIQGQSLVVPFQGSAPDVMFQFLAAERGPGPCQGLRTALCRRSDRGLTVAAGRRGAERGAFGAPGHSRAAAEQGQAGPAAPGVVVRRRLVGRYSGRGEHGRCHPNSGCGRHGDRSGQC